MKVLKHFTATAGDFEFKCERDDDGVCRWSKRLLNTTGADFEQISLKHVPDEVLHVFSREQITLQARSAA
jgi:hypothetical protein